MVCLIEDSKTLFFGGYPILLQNQQVKNALQSFTAKFLNLNNSPKTKFCKHVNIP